MTVEQIKDMVKPLGKSCASKVGLSPGIHIPKILFLNQ